MSSTIQLNKIAEFVRFELVPIENLKISKSNNRVDIPSTEDREILINSIKAIGIVEPLDVNESYEILSGQLRYLSAIDIGLKEVPVKVWRFKSSYHEKIFSLLIDTARTPLSDRDKYNFVCNALKDGKTIEDIAFDVGLSPMTIRGWYNWGKSPEIVQEISKNQDKETTKALEIYFDSGVKKKEVIDSILKSPEFSKDVKKSLDLIKSSANIPSRELDNIRKEVQAGLYVDISHRTEMLSKDTKLFSLRIPEELFNRLIKAMAKENKTDLHKFLLDLIEEWLQKIKA